MPRRDGNTQKQPRKAVPQQSTEEEPMQASMHGRRPAKKVTKAVPPPAKKVTPVKKTMPTKKTTK